MPAALIYRWAVFILLILGLILLMKHKVLTPFVFWSRIQYYTFSTFTLLWCGWGPLCSRWMCPSCIRRTAVT